ncbi:MAG: GNAT family N-acetyltransferase [Polyangiaceae bacterium]
MTHSTGVHVRAATTADLDSIAPMGAALVRFHHELDPERFLIVDGVDKGYRRFLEMELKNPSAVILAAQADGLDGIVGYAYGRVEGRDWTTLRDEHGALHDVYVDERARRRGVAEALIEVMISELKKRGVASVVLMSAWNNTSAQRVFERMGFRRTMVEMTCEIERDTMVEPAPSTTPDPSSSGR